MIVLEKHIVPDGIDRIRLSDYAPLVFSVIPSKKGLKKAIKMGAILVDQKKGTTGTWVKAGQILELIKLDQAPKRIFELRFPIVFQDEYLAVIQKPAAYPVSGNQFRTISNALPFNLQLSNQKDALQGFTAVHRLDAATTGLLLIAKTRTALIQLNKTFEQRLVKKKYQAVVIGLTPNEGTIEHPIEHKPSKSTYKKLDHKRSLKSGHLSRLELEPITGRTHQLRIHLQKEGFPILGDPLYSPPALLFKGKGLFLCATYLAFQHPLTEEPLEFEITPPPKFISFMEREQKRWEKYRIY
ncbi:MAG: RluA family pseudouridine synthase [Saprospiraceae bacterium]|nr:RluA family pseudouridine synthase [Saprospiraceae bacterium]